MIKNKLITITKENQFDMGWTIFTPYQLPFYKNPRYKSLLVTDIVRAITRSDKVYIVLSEECLASAIIKELEWVNKYTTIELIAKTEQITQRYSSIKFSRVKINPDITFNYLSIIGAISLSVMIDNGYTETNTLVKEVYFDGHSATNNFSFLSDLEEVMFVGDCFDNEYAELYNECLRQGKKTYRVINKRKYNKEIFDKFNGTKTLLLLSDFARSGILGFTRGGEIRKIFKAKEGLFFVSAIERVDENIGELYACVWQGQERTLQDIEGKKSIYAWWDKEIFPFAIKDKIVVERTIDISLMSDFISETFDKSETDKHNQYSAIAKNVEYQFTLVPPLKDDTYKLSCIYEPILSLAKEIKKVYKIDFVKAIEEIKNFSEQEGLSYVFAEINDWYKWFVKAVNDYTLKGFYSKNEQLLNLLKDTQKRLLSYCEQMFSEINTENSDTKFDKFDDEIAGYKRQVEEKKALIEQGIEVLKNTSRVKTLEKKISDLLGLKKRFEGTSSNRDSKELQAFLQKCNDVIAGRYKAVTSEESIGQVLEKTEKTKMMMLNSFVVKYLYVFNAFMEKAVSIVEKLLEIEIPEDYQVFEKDEQRYIVINELKEYEETKTIREKFNLLCLARR